MRKRQVCGEPRGEDLPGGEGWVLKGFKAVKHRHLQTQAQWGKGFTTREFEGHSAVYRAPPPPSPRSK